MRADDKLSSLDRHLRFPFHLRPVRAGPTHGPEHTALSLQQSGRGIELHDLPFPHDQHPIVVKHSIEPMCDSEHNRTPEFLVDCTLDLEE